MNQKQLSSGEYHQLSQQYHELAKEYHLLAGQHQALQGKHDELIAQMGDEIAPFPGEKMGAYMSHFRIVMEFLKPPLAGRILSIVSPLAAQTVSWSAPFIYSGRSMSHRVAVPLPKGSTLSQEIREDDFLTKPPGFFEVGKETIWLQILNLDARMDTEIGPIRIILGETLKREYPDLFMPSLGVAQSLGRKGFPANLYFNPYAIIETPIGAFRAIHGTLSYGRVTGFPPIGTPVSIRDCIPVEHVDEIRKRPRSRLLETVEPFARILALSHPIDMGVQLPGDDAYELIERLIHVGKPQG